MTKRFREGEGQIPNTILFCNTFIVPYKKKSRKEATKNNPNNLLLKWVIQVKRGIKKTLNQATLQSTNSSLSFFGGHLASLAPWCFNLVLLCMHLADWWLPPPWAWDSATISALYWCEYGNSPFALLIHDCLFLLFIPLCGCSLYCLLCVPSEQINILIMFILTFLCQDKIQTCDWPRWRDSAYWVFSDCSLTAEK